MYVIGECSRTKRLLNLLRGHLKRGGRCQISCQSFMNALRCYSRSIAWLFLPHSGCLRGSVDCVAVCCFSWLPVKDRLEPKLLPNEIDDSDTETSLTALMSVPIKTIHTKSVPAASLRLVPRKMDDCRELVGDGLHGNRWGRNANHSQKGVQLVLHINSRRDLGKKRRTALLDNTQPSTYACNKFATH